VLVNPFASTMTERLRHLVVAALGGRYEVDEVATQRRGHAIELAHAGAREGYDAIAVLGGDGTVNEAANGLAGSEVALTPLPGGATNVYCRMLGIPLDVVDATEALLARADAWAVRPLDLGRVNDRWFTFAAGAGLDASVVARVDRHPALKARFGPWFFAESAVATFLTRYVRDPLRLEVAMAGRTLRGVSVFVQNGAAYTYFRSRPIVLAPKADLASGSLAGAVLERASPRDVPTVAFRALSRTAPLSEHRQVRSFGDVTEVDVRSADGRPVPHQVDGDHLGDADGLRFTVVRGALQVVA
jgi:diacylglycerol kinase family enzyme